MSNRDDDSDRGFASMSDEEQKRIASEGGKASHGGGRGSSKRGFAAMSDEEQRKIASKGGKASHGGGRGGN